MKTETKMYVRKPFSVEAVQVTADNMAELADWCGGKVMGTPREDDVDAPPYFIKVDATQPSTDRQTMAFVNDWLLYAHSGYKVYTEKAFNRNFELAETNFDISLGDVDPVEVYRRTKAQLDAAMEGFETLRRIAPHPDGPSVYDPETDNSAVSMTQIEHKDKHLCSVCGTEFSGDESTLCPNVGTHPDQPASSSNS